MGTVYLAQDDTGYYKIGYTRRDPSARVRELSVGNSTIRLVKEFQTSVGQQLESYLHRRYAPNHVKGEWFSLTTEELAQFNTECTKFEHNVQSLREMGNPFV